MLRIRILTISHRYFNIFRNRLKNADPIVKVIILLGNLIFPGKYNLET